MRPNDTMRQNINNTRTSLENALMFRFSARLVGAAVALTLAAATPAFAQQLELKLMAPAAPGGGWDQVRAALSAGAVGADAKKINYIPFSGGGESLAAILGAKVTAGISGLSEYDGQIKSGKLRAIGVTSEKRIPGSDIPTFKEQG